FSQLVRCCSQLLAGCIQFRCRRCAFECFLRFSQRIFNIRLIAAGNLIPVLLQHLLDVVNKVIESVASLDLLAFRLVLSRMRFCILRHTLDFLFAQTRRRCDRDLLVLARALSFAVTFRMPLASISNVTSICGTPRGAGGMPLSLNFASVRFWLAI